MGLDCGLISEAGCLGLALPRLPRWHGAYVGSPGDLGCLWTVHYLADWPKLQEALVDRDQWRAGCVFGYEVCRVELVTVSGRLPVK